MKLEGRSSKKLCLFVALFSGAIPGDGSVPSPMARIVLLLPSSILAFLGVLHLVSSTILIGFLVELYFGSAVSEGLSSIMVPIPTNIASYSHLRRCTLSKSSLFDRFRRCLFGSAILPSAEAAQLSVTFGLTFFYRRTVKI